MILMASVFLFSIFLVYFLSTLVVFFPFTFNKFSLSCGFVLDLLYLYSGVEGLTGWLFYILYLFVLYTCFFGFFSYSFCIFGVFSFTFFFAYCSWLVSFLYFISAINFFVYLTKKSDPFFLTLILVPIEIVSEISRPFSLAIRLCVNVSVGHTLCVVCFDFYETYLGVFWYAVLLVPLESFVFIIQGYIFSRLVYTYLGH